MEAVTRTQFRLAIAILALTSCVVWVVMVPRERPKDPRENSISLQDYDVSTEPGFLCLGYAEGLGWWGSVSGNCPSGHAMLSNQDPAGPNKMGPPSKVPLSGACCKLPFADILTDTHVYNVIEKCPDNSVATGTNVDKRGQCTSNCGMRCTFINTEKYRLGEESASVYWRVENDGSATYGQGDSEMSGLSEVPLAIRLGIGREAHGRWDNDGCIGDPIGSLLVRKTTKECSGFFYRPLLYKDGRAVQMFPHCDAISDKFDPNAKCLVRKAR